jgi:hypothetical protein
MAKDKFVLDLDKVIFDTQIGSAIITSTTETHIHANGESQEERKHVCIVGDEKTVSLICSYITAGFSVPGTGELTIDSLNSDQVSVTTSDNHGIKFILQGSKFNAKLTMQASPKNGDGTPDPTPIFMGNGVFISSDTKGITL